MCQDASTLVLISKKGILLQFFPNGSILRMFPSIQGIFQRLLLNIIDFADVQIAPSILQLTRNTQHRVFEMVQFHKRFQFEIL